MANLENALVDQNERVGLPISENGGFLGTKFNEKVSTEQALKLSGLDYIVKSEPHSTIENYRDFYFEHENGKKDYFHSTNKSYKVIQNLDVANFIESMSKDFPSAEWYSMGSVHNDTSVFMQMRVKELDLILDPNGANDVTEFYLMGRSSHNGRYSLLLGMLMNRLFCSNQLPSLSSNENLITKKHTDRVFDNVHKSINVFSMAQNNLKTISGVANKLYSTKADFGDVQKIFDTLTPMPELKYDKGIETPRSKGSITQWENKRDLLHDVWQGKTNRGKTMDNLENNGWKVLQTLVELGDKFGGKGDVKARMTSELFNNDRQQKRQDWLNGTLNHFELDVKDYVVV